MRLEHGLLAPHRRDPKPSRRRLAFHFPRMRQYVSTAPKNGALFEAVEKHLVSFAFDRRDYDR